MLIPEARVWISIGYMRLILPVDMWRHHTWHGLGRRYCFRLKVSSLIMVPVYENVSDLYQ